MTYKCVDCKHTFDSTGLPEKCPKCGSEKWGKVDAKGDWTPQGESFATFTGRMLNEGPTYGITKRALIRAPGTPVGQPGKMHINCGCGNQVDMPDDGDGATCSKCGQKYDERGYLIEVISVRASKHYGSSGDEGFLIVGKDDVGHDIKIWTPSREKADRIATVYRKEPSSTERSKAVDAILMEEAEYPKTITKTHGREGTVTYKVKNKSEEDHLNQLLDTAESRGGSERLQRLAAAKTTYSESVSPTTLIVKLRTKDYTAAQSVFARLMQEKVNALLVEERSTLLFTEETCKDCGKDFTPTFGEYARCPDCLSKQHAAGEKATQTEDMARDDDFYRCKDCGAKSTSTYCDKCKAAGKEPDVPASGIKESKPFDSGPKGKSGYDKNGILWKRSDKLKEDFIIEEKVKCQECGKVFNAKVSAGAEPKCPKCGSYDIELNEATGRLVDSIGHGDRVTIVNRFGQKQSGKAVMRSSHGGWVLNMGGAHGTPGLADDSNVVDVKKAKIAGPTMGDRTVKEATDPMKKLVATIIKNDKAAQKEYDRGGEPQGIGLPLKKEDYDDDERNSMGFADPGGRSALRAGKRIYPCPTCNRPNMLTGKDKSLGYQCDRCADQDEGGF